MERDQAQRIIEALLYMTDHPLSVREIGEVLDLKTFGEEEIKSILEQIRVNFESAGSALTVVNVSGGWQVATRPEIAPWVRRLYKERLTVRLSPSALETLAIVAYKQPIARAEIEQIRGVEASGVVDTLVERRLIKVVGRKETIGRPLLYGTTTDFLRQFGLSHLSDLPDLATIAPGDFPEPQTSETDADTAGPEAGNLFDHNTRTERDETDAAPIEASSSAEHQPDTHSEDADSDDALPEPPEGEIADDRADASEEPDTERREDAEVAADDSRPEEVSVAADGDAEPSRS